MLYSTVRTFKILVPLAIIFAVICTTMQGCGKFGSARLSSESPDILGLPSTPPMLPPATPDSGFVILDRTNTFKHFKAITGIMNMDSGLRAMHFQKMTFLSEKGVASDIAATMTLAFFSIGSQVCSTAVNESRAVSPGVHLFKLSTLDTLPQDLIKSGGVIDVIQSMSNSFWGREANADEVNLLTNYYKTFESSTDKNADNSVFALCSIMISSVSTLRF